MLASVAQVYKRVSSMPLLKGSSISSKFISTRGVKSKSTTSQGLVQTDPRLDWNTSLAKSPVGAFSDSLMHPVDLMMKLAFPVIQNPLVTSAVLSRFLEDSDFFGNNKISLLTNDHLNTPDRLVMDFKESPDAFSLTADLPGIRKDDIKLTIKDGVLVCTVLRNQKHKISLYFNIIHNYQRKSKQRNRKKTFLKMKILFIRRDAKKHYFVV